MQQQSQLVLKVIIKKVIVHVKQADLINSVYGQRFILDGEIYSVDACDDDMGLLTIALVANDI